MIAIFGTTGTRRLVAVLALALLLASAGCDTTTDDGGATEAPPVEQEAEQPAEEQAEYTSWEVYVNDEDSYEEGGITYTVALNLTATNPTPTITGAYAGTATASTSSVGTVGGQQLNASAIANSTTLEFALESMTGEELAPLTDDTPEYIGTGSIVMKAAGSGTIGAAGGSFENTSGQNLKLTVLGSQVTLEVVLSGHTYTFQGTITGK